MYAAYLDDREIFGREIEVKTRTCHALGVEKGGGKFFEMIAANQPTPGEREQHFTNDTDNMTSLDLNVYQGSAPDVKDNTLIGTVNITDLPPAKADSLDIKVIFKVDTEQNVTAIVEIDEKRWAGSFSYA